MSVGRPRESGDGAWVAFEDVEAGGGAEVEDYGGAFVGSDGESLRFTVEIDGGEAASGRGDQEKTESDWRDRTYVRTSSLRMTVAAWWTVSRSDPTVGSSDFTTASATRGSPM
jgi:hypothetical protein